MNAYWTVADYAAADAEAARLLCELRAHGPYTAHCGGYDVAAWPCSAAAKVLAALLPRPAVERDPNELDMRCPVCGTYPIGRNVHCVICKEQAP